MSVLIADRSNNNGPDDYPLAKEHGLAGVWLKVGEGASYVDKTWPDRARRARAAGLRVGGYFFIRPDQASAPEQAQRFARLLGEVQRRDLRPVLDFEARGSHWVGRDAYAWASSFLVTLRKATGVCGLIYGSPGFLGPLEFPRTVGCGLWLAAYGQNDAEDHPFSIPAPWRHAVAHQFTSEGRWPGLDGKTDLSHAQSLRPLLAHPLTGRL